MVTALHQNSNNIRKVKMNTDGTERIAIHRKKSTNLTPTAYWVKEKADYGEHFIVIRKISQQFFLFGYICNKALPPLHIVPHL